MLLWSQTFKSKQWHKVLNKKQVAKIMSKKVWPINDSLHCQQLTSEYLEEALALIETAFFPYESISRTLRISADPEALLELRSLTKGAALDGVSVIAIDKKTNKIVGISLNKIQVKDGQVFETFSKAWKRPSSQAIVEFMASIDNLCNLFDYCEVDCLLELMFLATSPDCRGLGVGRKLVEVSLEIAKNLLQGINMKRSVDGREISLEPVPRLASAIFTTFVTQKISRELGFQVAAEKRFEELYFRGLDFADVVHSGTEKLTLEYLKL